MAEDLLHDHFQTIENLTLIPSSGGVYEITYGDKQVWSKKESGDFPDPEAIQKWFAANAS